MEQQSTAGDAAASGAVPIGARIIRTARAYDSLMDGKWGLPANTPVEAIKELWRDVEAEHDPVILQALERVVTRNSQIERALSTAGATSESPVGAV
jgi:HD-GYP domain-containing protein (c-di-GMP phosphodiesterase class II)